MTEPEQAAAAWDPPTQNHDPAHIAFARECYAAGYEAGATALDILWAVQRLRAEIERLRARESEAAAIIAEGICHADAMEAEIARLKAKTACPECRGAKVRWYALDGMGTCLMCKGTGERR